MHDVERLAEVLASGGDVVRSMRADAVSLLHEIEAWPADVLLIATDAPSRDMVEQVCVASAGRERPILMFTETDDAGAMRALVKAGVSAYVVAGCVPSRLRSVINVALERFAHEQARYQIVESAKRRDEDDRVIAKAKAYLQRQGLSEPQAHAMLRKTAMSERRTIADIAHRLVGA